MISRLNYRVVLFAFAFVFGVVFSAPNFLQTKCTVKAGEVDTNQTCGKKVTLGLDLQGGLHLLLSVKTEEAVKSRMKSVAGTISYVLDREDMGIDGLELDEETGEIRFEVLDEDEVGKIKDILVKELPEMKIVPTGTKVSVTMLPKAQIAVKEYSVLQAVDTIRNRLDQFGLAEPTVAQQGKDQILVEVPGVKTNEERERIKALIAKPAYLTMMAVDEGRANDVYGMSDAEAKSYGDIILPDVNNPQEKYLLKAIPILTGSMLTDAKATARDGKPIITFELSGDGGRIFADFTEVAKERKDRMAVVLDNKVYTAPHIQTRIGGGKGEITGSFTQQETKDIAIALRSGALLAPVALEEERSVGPSLGADNIQASTLALIFGFVAVILFMIIYYGISGLIADIALVGNLVLILAIMSLFGATLTLPGMAGIVLTVGMAVDANVIINERIRELLKSGKSIAKSIEDGYANAFTAIWDANVTTLITSILLFVFGSGPIKGFAVTMTIGILASMLTAILGTHGIYEMFISKIKKDKLGLWFGIRAKE